MEGPSIQTMIAYVCGAIEQEFSALPNPDGDPNLVKSFYAAGITVEQAKGGLSKFIHIES